MDESEWKKQLFACIHECACTRARLLERGKMNKDDSQQISAPSSFSLSRPASVTHGAPSCTCLPDDTSPTTWTLSHPGCCSPASSTHRQHPLSLPPPTSSRLVPSMLQLQQDYDLLLVFYVYLAVCLFNYLLLTYLCRHARFALNSPASHSGRRQVLQHLMFVRWCSAWCSTSCQ